MQARDIPVDDIHIGWIGGGGLDGYNLIGWLLSRGLIPSFGEIPRACTLLEKDCHAVNYEGMYIVMYTHQVSQTYMADKAAQMTGRA
eukprot:1499567-Ditylum_brightwellii.AAC.1